MGCVVEGTGDQHIKTSLGGFPGRGHQIRTGNGAELGTDEDPCALLGFNIIPSLDIAPLRTNECAWPRGDGGERNPVFLVSLLDTGGVEMLQDDAGKVLGCPVAVLHLCHGVDQLVVCPTPRTRWGEMLSTVKGPATRTFFPSS